MTEETSARATEKPKTSTDIACPACGAPVGALCRRRVSGLSFKAAQQTACHARYRKFMEAHGLGRRYKPKRRS